MAPYGNKIDNNEIFDYCNSVSHFRMDQPELTSKRIIVTIRLSKLTKLHSIKERLAQNLSEFACEEDDHDITVSGYPTSTTPFDNDDVLVIVKEYDSDAEKV